MRNYAITLPDGSFVTILDTGRTGEYGKHVYQWQLSYTSEDQFAVDTGEDLESHADAVGALEAFLGFLSACAESYAYKMRNPESEPENLDLFSPRVAEWAYMNSDEITLAMLDLEDRS